MNRAVVVDAVRTPVGKGRSSGALAELHPVELLAHVLTQLVERTGVDPALIDDVIAGNVTQAGEQSGTPARQAALAAGFPTHVPGVTVERKCGSGQQAVDFAVQGVMAGAYDIVVAAGVESMSRVRMGSNRMGEDPFGPSVRQRFPNLTSQGVAAEMVAHQWGLTRDQLDEYSAESHRRADVARSQGWFDREIVPVETARGIFGADETVRPGTTAESIASLAPVFASDEMRARFPHIDWMVTAASSSQLADGAAALLIMSENKANELGLRALAAVHASAVVGDDPELMLTGPIPATARVLERADLAIADIAAFEVNEAFAPVPLAWQAEFGVESKLLNPLGGAIALGHPLGASGARIMTTLIHHLDRTGGRFGLQTMCEAGGMANATIIESLTSSDG